jgi:asparagine synthase (glutamine-hydrolysing)
MSGIVGAWNLDGRPLDAATLASMSAALRHRGPDGEGRWVSGACGLACQHQWTTPEEIGERQPLAGVTGSADLAVVLDGRLDNRDELLPALDLPRAASDAVCVAAAYAAWGPEFAARLNGDFALAVYDGPRRTLILARDAIGLRPLYYHRGPRVFAFASEIKSLLVHPDIPRRVDDEGLADFMLIGARPVDRLDVTCFADISALVPAHLTVVTPERTAVRRYWDFDPLRVLKLGSVQDYAEALRTGFAEAVRRRVRAAHPVAVSVSGGIDSSSIYCQAAALHRSGRAPHPPAGVSYVGAEGGDADERRYLVDIEQAFGIAIDRFPLDPFIGLIEGADEQVRAIEAPFLDYMWGVTRELYRRASAGGARVLLSGQWGDQVLFSTAYLIDLFGRGAWPQVWRHTREYARWFGDAEAGILRRRFLLDLGRHHVPAPLVPPLKRLRQRWFGARPARGAFSDAFLALARRSSDRPARLGSDFHSAHARSIYFEARSKYHVQCMEWNNKAHAIHGLTPAFPFLDRDLLALLMAIPGEIQTRDGVPRGLFRDAMQGVLPDTVRARTWKADFTDVVNHGVARDRGAVAAALGPDCQGVRLGYLDGGRLEAEVGRLSDDLVRADSVNSWELADLFGLEVWLRAFSTSMAGSTGPMGASTDGY